MTEEAVAGHFQIVPRMVDVMTTLFRAQGLLQTAPDRTLHLTPMAEEHLVAGSPWCLAAFLNEAKDGPLHVAEYSVTLAHATQGRCYSVGELRTWLTAAGFTDISHDDTVASRGLMTARKPAIDGARRAGK